MILMDINRVRQIYESKGVIEVLYNNAPVWIENIRGDNAEVTYIGTDKKVEAPVGKLMEKFTI
jgi:small acid-soluble spore protein H (minor)